jgi:type I restriction enzyme S subunit
MCYIEVSNVDKISKEDEILVELCNYTDVYNNDFITSDLEFMLASATEEEIRKFQLNIGDVVITKDSESWDDIGIPALVIEIKEKLLCGYHLAIIKADQTKIIPEYLFRCIEAKIIRIQLELASTGVTRFGLPKDEIGRLKLPIPNLSIQEKIVSFLRIELLFIDRLIAQKEQLISLLFEKRQALITQAVTRGLDPNVKLKNSGVDWIGDVPEHWEVKKVKYAVDKIDELVDKSDFVIAVENIESKTGRLIGLDKINNYEGSLNGFNEGDVIFNKLRPYLAKVYIAESQGAIVGELLVLRAKQIIYPPFLFYRFLSPDFISEVDSSTVGTKMPRANWDDFIKHLKIGIPPYQEQVRVIKLLDKELKKTNDLIYLTQHSVDLLKERRTTLISAAVAGQIKHL